MASYSLYLVYCTLCDFPLRVKVIKPSGYLLLTAAKISFNEKVCDGIDSFVSHKLNCMYT